MRFVVEFLNTLFIIVTLGALIQTEEVGERVIAAVCLSFAIFSTIAVRRLLHSEKADGLTIASSSLSGIFGVALLGVLLFLIQPGPGGVQFIGLSGTVASLVLINWYSIAMGWNALRDAPDSGQG